MENVNLVEPTAGLEAAFRDMAAEWRATGWDRFAGAFGEFAAYVEGLDGNVVCERSVYGNNRTWAHDSIGVTAPAPTWYLAEGSTDGGMETFVLVQNPGNTAVNVNITFQTDMGEVAPPALQGVAIPAMSRVTFKANDFVTSYNVSTKVEATDGNVVCERSMYGNNRTWAHDSIGYAP